MAKACVAQAKNPKILFPARRVAPEGERAQGCPAKTAQWNCKSSALGIAVVRVHRSRAEQRSHSRFPPSSWLGSHGWRCTEATIIS